MKTVLPYVTNVSLHRRDTSYMEVLYTNKEEPMECCDYLIQLEYSLSQWHTRRVCIYKSKSKRYEDIGDLFSNALMEQIKETVLFHLRSDNIKKLELETKDAM